MKTPIKGILFDKDGTLLDYHLSWAPINVRAAELAAGGNKPLADHLLAVGGLDGETCLVRSGSVLAAGTTTQIAQAWIDAGSPFELVELTPLVDQIFREGVATAVPVLDLSTFFRRLKARGIVIGIASSDGELAIRMTAERFGFADVVDFIAGYDSGHGPKPEPGMLHAFAAFAQLRPAEIAVVGDNLHDMEMAQRGGAGLRVAVLTGTGRRDELEAASDLCLASIDELEQSLFE